MPPIAKILVMIGAGIMLVGLLVWLLGDKLNWFGNLPGDVRVERENFRFYAPFATMIVVSILLSLLLWLFRKFF